MAKEKTLSPLCSFELTALCNGRNHAPLGFTITASLYEITKKSLVYSVSNIKGKIRKALCRSKGL